MSAERRRAAATGALAAAAALGAAELLAALPALPSPVELLGAWVVAVSPPALTDAAIGAFGTANVLVLQACIVLTVLLVGAGAGLLAVRAPVGAAAVVIGSGALAVLSASASPEHSATAASAPVAAAALAAVAVLRFFRPAQDGTTEGEVLGRRSLLKAGTVVAGVAVLSAVTGRMLSAGQSRVAAVREAVRLPRPPDPLSPPAATASVDVEGVSSLFTPNDDFFLIDTALRPPRVDVEGWRLEVSGLVDRPFSLSYDELLEMSTDEEDITLACVSNEVGGFLVGTARWQGVRLDVLLERAGVRPEAAQVVGRAVDGFDVGFPVAAVEDGRAALVAVGMNGEPLPVANGFPARLVVAGLYGYVSATKWLAEIELADDEFEGYWVPRGWAKEAPVKISSRIDVPGGRTSLQQGRIAVAGVAWAPLAGVGAVEVAVDDGEWQPAALADELNGSSWRQWVFQWEAEPGRHRLQARATDNDGRVQEATASAPRPDGATGLHSVVVDVT